MNTDEALQWCLKACLSGWPTTCPNFAPMGWHWESHQAFSGVILVHPSIAEPITKSDFKLAHVNNPLHDNQERIQCYRQPQTTSSETNRTKLLKAFQLSEWDENEIIRRAVALAEPIEQLRDILSILKGESLEDILTIAVEQLRNDYATVGTWNGTDQLRRGHIVAGGAVVGTDGAYVTIRDADNALRAMSVADVQPPC